MDVSEEEGFQGLRKDKKVRDSQSDWGRELHRIGRGLRKVLEVRMGGGEKELGTFSHYKSL